MTLDDLGHPAATVTRLPAAWTPFDELRSAVGPTPCVARPHAGLVHRDGPCQCFVGGPAPEHAERPEDVVLALAWHGAA
ncbi:hypothetical protein FA014_07850 [Cellulomonas hominis]|uniref:Uncharacterized protein n=1 Tax=Cellulomonas hominis TaxID=156981 RepID=A0A7Z8JZP6_9CELL|nr:hypothetical protein [Cellulomonas hominis]TKR24114.1 hypothetical protein FA014_07850 [Cellulomonas hominis]